eukprot:TRINITY_DN4406_c0_g1_i2.p2 TRINITY_DN4406_c0_g1~~TRINITY_DN4406_c0_g1_i2.p2  ORF type:complete len:112 (-),score=6.48 TRINITY_DN4406_c0_g1_i2:176-511(-)
MRNLVANVSCSGVVCRVETMHAGVTRGVCVSRDASAWGVWCDRCGSRTAYGMRAGNGCIRGHDCMWDAETSKESRKHQGTMWANATRCGEAHRSPRTRAASTFYAASYCWP